MGRGVSLCMIVRDEAENLGRCLGSVQGHVDEIVVVDTGSRDATVEVARAFGARVLHLPWPDDFAAARNRSLEEADGEWIVVLDADEELPAAQGLRQLAAADNEAWTFTIVSPLGEDTATRHQALRLFRNRPEHRFAGLVHEQVQPSIFRRDPAARIRHADLEIRHYGYGARGAGDKTARNIRLLQKALAANPTDPFLNYNLGVSYLVGGDPARGRTHFEIAFLAPEKGSGWAPSLYRNYAICLHELGEYAVCLQVLDQGLGDYPAYPDLHFLKGEVFFDVGLLSQARACFLTCTRVCRIPPEYTTMDGVTTHLALDNLARIAVRQGDLDLAADYLAAACRQRKGAGALRLGRVLQQKGLAGRELREALAGYLDADALAGVLFDLGEYEACLGELGPAPQEPSCVLLAARCLTMAGRPAAALPLVERLPPGTAGRAEVAWLAGRLQEPAGAPVSTAALPLVLEAAGAAWLRGDTGTALSLLPARPQAQLALARWALERERPAVAEAVLAGEPPGAQVSCLKGRACAAQGRHREAALHFLAAAETGGKTAWPQALAAVISHCQSLVLDLLKGEGPASPLQAELFRLASRQKKLGRSEGGIDR